MSIQIDSRKYPSEQCKCLEKIDQQWHCHQQKMRWFLVVISCVVYPTHCVVFRWKCSLCGATFTNLPSICVGQKLYLRCEIESRSQSYLETPSMTYRQSVENDGREVAYHKEEKDIATTRSTQEEKEKEIHPVMAHTTVQRWISSIANVYEDVQPVVAKAVEIDVNGDLSLILIAPNKYRSDERKRVLQCACFLLRAKKLVQLKNPTRYAPRGASP